MKISILAIMLSLVCIACGRDSNRPNQTWNDQSLEDCASDLSSGNVNLCKSLMLHRYLDGAHKLRKMAPKETSAPYSRSTGSFFLFLGDYQSETGAKITSAVEFAWLMRDGAYAISVIDINLFRVELDETVQQPYVYFKWRSPDWSPYPFNVFSNTADFYTRAVREVTVVCRPEDWPTDIILPMNK